MAPSITECVFALGAGERVIAVTDWCTHPPEARERARVGGFLDPNLELIAALRPDLVIAQGRAPKVASLCRDRGIGIVLVDIHDLESLYSTIGELGGLLALEEEASRLVSDIRGRLEKVACAVGGLPRRRVFLCTGRRPGSLATLGTTSAEGILSELLAIAGGDNVFAELDAEYSQVSKEALLARDPEVVIELRPQPDMTDAERARAASEWKALRSLRAAREGRVHVLTEEYLMTPGPRVWMTAEALARALHPGVELE
jgi:iron complex transport system substrate-binding protein